MFDVPSFYKELNKIYEGPSGGGVIDFLIEKLAHARFLNDSDGIIIVLNELGSVHRVRGEVEEAHKCFDEVLLKLNSRNKLNTLNHANVLINIGDVHMVAKNYSGAINSFNIAEEILESLDGNTIYTHAAICNNRSMAYKQSGNLNKAKNDLIKSMKLLEKLDDLKVERLTSKVNLAELLIQLGDFNQAKVLITKAINSFERLGLMKDIHYPNALATLAQLLYLQGDYSGSYGFYQRAIELFEFKTGPSKMSRMLRGNLEKVKMLLEKS